MEYPQEEKQEEEAIDWDDEEAGDSLAGLPQRRAPREREIKRQSTLSKLFDRGNKVSKRSIFLFYETQDLYLILFPLFFTFSSTSRVALTKMSRKHVIWPTRMEGSTLKLHWKT